MSKYEMPSNIVEFEARTRALPDIAWPLAFDEILGLFIPFYIAAGWKWLGPAWTIYSAVGLFGFLLALARLA